MNRKNESTHREISTLIIRYKRILRANQALCAKHFDEIRKLNGFIASTSENPFFKHRHAKWRNRIDYLQESISELLSYKHKSQEMLITLIRAFDSVGPAPVNVYAALLSTHHVHVERAMAEGARNLFDLINATVEDGSQKSEWIGENAILCHTLTEVVVREIFGRPLTEYRLVECPNGETVAKPVKPLLKVVKTS